MANFDRVAFVNFLKAVHLKKDIKNEEALFNFKKDSIETIVISSEKTVAIKGTFKSSFSDVGKVGIINLGSIITYIEALVERFKIAFLKNKLSLSSKSTKINVTLQSPEYILNSLDESKFNELIAKTQKGTSLSMSKEVVQYLLSTYNIIAGNELSLKSENKKLYFCCNNSNTGTELETVFDKEVTKEDYILRLPKFFLSVLEQIARTEDIITINFAKERPVSVSIGFENDNYSLDYIISLVAEKEKDA